jgi:hypothetical protein
MPILHAIVRKNGEKSRRRLLQLLSYTVASGDRSDGTTMAARRTGRIREEIDGDGEWPSDGWDLEAPPRLVP